MLLQTKNLKFINNTIKGLAITMLVASQLISAQEIIPEAVKPVETNVVSTEGTQKVDGVAAVVGEYIILESDIDKAFLQLKAQGANVENLSRCELFGKLLEDKLYAHQAVQDSIVVNDSEVKQNVDYQIEQFLQQSKGSIDNLLELYHFKDEQSFRDEMFQINKANLLASKMQAKVVEEVEITPEEVREFFNKIPDADKPIFGTELRVAQIVAEPKVTKEEEQRIIDRLKQIKKEILDEGVSFNSKAILYSEDPGSASKGGKYTLNRTKPQMVKEFREVVFSLQEGEISEPFKTEFGYHIIKCEKIRGQEYDVAHILLIPHVSDQAIQDAKDRLTKTRESIVKGDITFADAAKASSDEKETREDGGQLINPETQDYNFELTRIEPELYSQIQNLKSDEVSPVIKEQDRTGNLKFKILKVTDRIDEHKANYAQDYLKIKKLALNERKINAIAKWQKEKINDTYIKISDNNKNCQFTNNWLKK